MQETRECIACRKQQPYPQTFLRRRSKLDGAPVNEYKVCNICSERQRKNRKDVSSAAHWCKMKRRRMTFIEPSEPPASMGRYGTPLLIMAALQKFRCPICRDYIPCNGIYPQTFDDECPEKEIPVCRICLKLRAELTVREKACLRDLHKGWTAVMGPATDFFDYISYNILPCGITSPDGQ